MPAALGAAALVVLALAGDLRSERDSYPLTLLVQVDAYAGDDTTGGGLRLRRLRVGEDVAAGSFRLRGVLEAQSRDAAGTYFAPIDGGRLSSDGPVRVTDAFVSWAPRDAFHAEVGSMRVPFSLSRQIDEGWLRLPERPAFVAAIAPDFRAGAGIGGDLGALLYGAGVFAASRTLDRDLFARGAFAAARLAAEPIGPVGTMPWRRPSTDPWYDWFRFAVGASILYGTLLEPSTLGAGADASAQWRRMVVTGEYLFQHAPSGDRQGAVVEPGITALTGRLDVTARAAWQRAAGADGWSGGLALTAYAREPALRVQLGVERRAPESYIAILRLTASID
jgi:hypothetical protein